MLIAYGKIGRAFTMDPLRFGVNGGDNEPAGLLQLLHEDLPDAKFLLMSKCSDPVLPSWVINPWDGKNTSMGKIENAAAQQAGADRLFREILEPWLPQVNDVVMWIGQHGSSNNRIPMTNGSGLLTSPLISLMTYAGPLIQFINAWQDWKHRDVTWLIADTRNYLKARDIKYPPRGPILGQHDERHGARHWTGEKIIDVVHQYVYSGLELCGVPAAGVPSSETRKFRFGMVVNETRADVRMARVDTIRQWAAEAEYIHGTWSDKSQKILDRVIKPIPYADVFPLMSDTKYMITLPGSGAGWATAKPWECFSRGTICFFHPKYDDQNHILAGNEGLTDWLRVTSAKQMYDRMTYLDEHPDEYAWLVSAQYQWFLNKRTNNQIVRLIRERLEQ